MTESTIPSDHLESSTFEPSPSAIVVGFGPVFDDVANRLLPQAGFTGSVHCVDGYLLAMGHIREHGPPSVIIGSLEALDGLAGSLATSLRRLAPDARLWLVVKPDQESDARKIVGSGFDGYVVEPVDLRAMANVVGNEDEESVTAGESVATAQEASAALVADVESTFWSGIDRAPATVEQLGDVDLIEQLLRDRRELMDLALRMVRTRGNLASAALVSERRQVPSGHQTIPVEFHSQSFGYLHAAPPATDLQLKPWAEWLARWAALEHRVSRLWELAARDPPTNLWNRRYFESFLDSVLKRAASERFRVTLMIYDIDNFKQFNDTYGHLAGDEILYETGRLMQSLVRTHDVVARVGGDEFAVIFWDDGRPRHPDSQHPRDVIKAAERFRRAIYNKKFPKLGDEAPGSLTVSGGLAGFPWDGRTREELIELADQMALKSKRHGKNSLTYGPGVMRVSAAEKIGGDQ